MNKVTTITLKTASNCNFSFDVYPKSASFKDVIALYAFLKREDDKWKVLYIGKTLHLGDRISSHNKWPEVNHLGCSHIAVCRQVSRLGLDDAERDLIGFYRPCCNEQLVP